MQNNCGTVKSNLSRNMKSQWRRYMYILDYVYELFNEIKLTAREEYHKITRINLNDFIKLIKQKEKTAWRKTIKDEGTNA